MNKILIIDDDEELCEEICDILIDEGFELDKAYDGLYGLELIDRNQYDLVLLDLKIPKMTGFKILEKVKEKYPELKVIVLSGMPFNKEMLKKQYMGANEELNILKLADAIISKPYDIEVLLSKIKSLLKNNS